MMLRYMKLSDYANLIQNGIYSVLKQREKTTADLGGSASMSEYTDAIIHNFK